MSSCANVSRLISPADIYDCPVPEAYPDDPTLNDLIYALNDTYLAWEACHEAVKGQN